MVGTIDASGAEGKATCKERMELSEPPYLKGRAEKNILKIWFGEPADGGLEEQKKGIAGEHSSCLIARSRAGQKKIRPGIIFTQRCKNSTIDFW